MKNIKFRGRRPNGEWVEGAYIPPEYTQLGYASILTKNRRFEVDPETVSVVKGGNGMKKVYISHPFTGNELENKMDAQEVCVQLKLEHPDWCLINPLDAFNWADRVKLTYDEILEMCIDLMLMCDTVYMCLGWDDSKGCRAERERAQLQGMEVLYE